MSVNRENVTWPAVDGTFNIGFWAFYDVNRDDDDWDYEWDVEYVNDRFWWTSTGHRTPEAAMDAYRRQEANPGGGWTIATRVGNEAECERLDGILASSRQAHLR